MKCKVVEAASGWIEPCLEIGKWVVVLTTLNWLPHREL